MQEYYDIIRSPECVPLGHSVNPNIALVTGMSCHADEQEAIRRGLDGFRFFGYSLGYVGIFGEHRPGVTNIWQRFLEVKDKLPDNAGRGGIGTPDQVRAHLQGYEDAGVDQVIFVQQSGTNRHEHICELLELFARRCCLSSRRATRCASSRSRRNWRRSSNRRSRASRACSRSIRLTFRWWNCSAGAAAPARRRPAPSPPIAAAGFRSRRPIRAWQPPQDADGRHFVMA